MKSLVGVFIALFLTAFAVGCTGGGGEPNTNEGTTENYEDPNYRPSYETGPGDSSSPK
jgi:hypothetical protein